MADYRFSAKPISRGKGQSSVASAAYRSASRLVDERTGEIHDYTRKQGVIHSEVMTPKATPEWMADRTQLWNAVEAVETRKNSQLAREIQLSLPHELNDDQRRALVRDFASEQFVARGMIADINIHLPDKQGDERNHHAHVMLTMRELTADGFHSKKATPTARSWNDDDLLKTWRAEWAHHQNRALERHGHDARVDHRSYEERGIDREPTQHRGAMADDMERKGKRSRIGDENREIEERNAKRAMEQVELIRETAKLAQEQARLSAKHGEQHRRLKAELNSTYGQAKQTIAVEIEAVDRRLQSTGARKVFRDLFGRTKADLKSREDLGKAMEQIQTSEKIRRDKLEREQRIEKQKLARQQRDTEDKLKRWSEQEREAREKSPQKPREPDKGHEVAKPSPEPAKPLRDDLVASQPPWESDILSNDKDRPAWESDLFKPKNPEP